MERFKHIYIASECSDGGIYHYILREDELIFCEKTDVDRPMYLTMAQGCVHAVLRQPFENHENSGVCSWEIQADGSLHNQSKILNTGGICGCHLCVEYGHTYVTNYFSGNIIRLPDGIAKEHGRNAHPHCVIPTPEQKYLAVADLELDQVTIYDKDFKQVSVGFVPKGQGSRHLCFSPNGKFLYCVNELGSTVTAFSYSAGTLTNLGTYGKVPHDYIQKNSAAAIRIDSEYLYISHRGIDKIEVFPMMSDGKLGDSKFYDCGGKTPRDILKVGSIMLSANLESDTVSIMSCENGLIGAVKYNLTIKRPLAILAMEDKEITGGIKSEK